MSRPSRLSESGGTGTVTRPRGRGGRGGGSTALATRQQPSEGALGPPQPRLKMTVLKPEEAGMGGAGGNRVARQPVYGEIVDSDYVHDEIRELGDQVKDVIKKNFQRHGTEEKQVLAGIRQFGPSKQAKKMLNKENEAARLAYEKGVYCVWRATEEPRLRGANNDFCCRVGARHRCFCGHTFANHLEPSPSRGGLTQQHPCQDCGCKAFKYVPNEPEEIGEGWLTRRSNWDPAKWSAKCRCDHGHRDHDPATLTCRACGCCGFQSHFLCVVCDLPWEAHQTVYETEAERHKAGFPVRQDYFPLSNIDWDVRELVLKDVTGGGALEPPPGYEVRRLSNSQGRGAGGPRRIRGRGAHPRVQEITDESPVSGGGALSYATADYCPSCATIYKDDGDSCGRCGRPRPGRR